MDTLYREHILDHFRNPRHRGRLSNPTASYEAWNPLCGDKIRISVKVQPCELARLNLMGSGARILEIAWEGEGCAISLAAASILTEEIINKPIEEIQKLSYDDMLGFLKISLTPARLKCGMLALEGVKGALRMDSSNV